MPKTLLLADDSVTIQKVVGISFASEDVELIAVDNGEDALKRARTNRPDVILADVVMPAKNGYEVCEAIKADPALRHIPVLLLTGTFEAFDAERARQVGAAGHIAKPFEAQMLVARVKQLFAESEAAARSAASAPAPSEIGEPTDADADSFDFFDDDLESASDSRPLRAGEPAAEFAGSSFEFGDDDLAPAKSVSPTTLADTDPVAPASTYERAIPVRFDRHAEFEAIGDLSELSDLEPMDGVVAGDQDSLAPLDASASSGEPFDFAFDASSQSPPTDPVFPEDAALRVDADDLAKATQLDPRGADDFDVSSSDLGPIQTDSDFPSPFGSGPAPDQTVLASTELFDEPEVLDAPLAEPVPMRSFGEEPMAAELDPVRSFGEEPMAAEFDPMRSFGEDPMAAELDPMQSFGEDPMVEFDPAFSDELTSEPEPMRRFGGEPLDDDLFEPPVAVSIEDEPNATVISTEFLARPEPDDSRASETAARAQAVLEQIGPQLREEIHDTLEKIAWESFGDLTDVIVRQSVERVEAIAWEVIPQLAETLIREEIRKLKGQTD